MTLAIGSMVYLAASIAFYSCLMLTAQEMPAEYADRELEYERSKEQQAGRVLPVGFHRPAA